MKPSKMVVAVFLALPMHAFAQFDASTIAGPAAKPVCVYKGVMSDAEIELCTGHPVYYHYGVHSGHVATRASPSVVVVKPATKPARRTARAKRR